MEIYRDRDRVRDLRWVPGRFPESNLALTNLLFLMYTVNRQLTRTYEYGIREHTYTYTSTTHSTGCPTNLVSPVSDWVAVVNGRSKLNSTHKCFRKDATEHNQTHEPASLRIIASSCASKNLPSLILSESEPASGTSGSSPCVTELIDTNAWISCGLPQIFSARLF